MLELVLSLFSISNEESLRIGFNSLMAGAEINQLHFEGIVLDDFLEKGAILPIERFKKKLLFESSLFNPKDEINVYEIGVRIYETLSPARALFIEPNSDDFLEDESKKDEARNSLSFVVGFLINLLLQQEVPHNVVMTKSGFGIYIIPRAKGHIQGVENGWLEVCGVFRLSSEDAYNNLAGKDYQKIVRLKMSIDEEGFQEFKTNIQSKFLSVFK